MLRIEDLRLGASPEEWYHFSNNLNLTEHLYPVVCKPDARIASKSTLMSVGKIPSVYTKMNYVVGIQGWVSKKSTENEVKEWSQNPDYGISINCTEVRAFDVDVDDLFIAAEIKKLLLEYFTGVSVRGRENSSRFLLPFKVQGAFRKTVMLVNRNALDDKIEFLANGQQFQACGLHTKSYTMYEWTPALPETIPVITEAQLQEIWHKLTVRFAIGDTEAISRKDDRKVDPNAPGGLDALGNFIINSDAYRGMLPTGNIMLKCPFSHEHTSESSLSSTVYMPPSNGYHLGHFKCMHGHCQSRTYDEFTAALGYQPEMFEPVHEAPDEKTDETPTANINPYNCVPLSSFHQAPPPSWLIKGIIPRGDVVMIYGESGSGKSFLLLDMLMAIAKGESWNELSVTQGRVVYICAEGSAGFGTRVKAYSMEKPLPSDLSFQVIPLAPNLLKAEDCSKLISSIRVLGSADVIAIDTLAQVIPGANENSSEGMSQALTHCKAINRATGATVLLVHHSGKDTTKGARGWSGIKGALDAEIEVTREENVRSFKVTKQKDGREAPPTLFNLNEVYICDDDEGDKVTSCTIELLGFKAKRPKPIVKSVKPMEYYTDVVAEALSSLALTGIENPTFLDVRDYCTRISEPYDTTNKTERTKIIRKVIDGMVASGKIHVTKGRLSIL